MAQNNILEDILIVVDCGKTGGQLPSSAVAMYAADAGIALDGPPQQPPQSRTPSQGTNELWVKVRPETVLRWRAVPLQSQTADGGTLQVMITQVKLWGATGDQLDAYQFLGNWAANPGPAAGIIYPPGSQQLSPPDPGSGPNASSSVPVNVIVGGINDPYVEATCLGNMPGAGYIAYSFTCTAYKNGDLKHPYASVTWDPFVTVAFDTSKR